MAHAMSSDLFTFTPYTLKFKENSERELRSYLLEISTFYSFVPHLTKVYITKVVSFFNLVNKS